MESTYAQLKSAMYSLAARYGWNKARKMIEEALRELENDQWNGR